MANGLENSYGKRSTYPHTPDGVASRDLCASPMMPSMSSNTNGFAAPRARDIEHSRQAKVAPLLATGMSVRAISAETGISVGAVHRAKRQLEKAITQGKTGSI